MDAACCTAVAREGDATLVNFGVCVAAFFLGRRLLSFGVWVATDLGAGIGVGSSPFPSDGRGRGKKAGTTGSNWPAAPSDVARGGGEGKPFRAGKKLRGGCLLARSLAAAEMRRCQGKLGTVPVSRSPSLEAFAVATSPSQLTGATTPLGWPEPPPPRKLRSANGRSEARGPACCLPGGADPECAASLRAGRASRDSRGGAPSFLRNCFGRGDMAGKGMLTGRSEGARQSRTKLRE